MMKTFFKIFMLLIVLLHQVVAFAASPIDDARNFFERYVKLCHSYDKTVANMYSDNALIKRTLIMPNKKTKTIIIPAKEYIDKLKVYRFLAKTTGYKNFYSNLKFSMENNNVRIEGIRKVNLDNFTGPISMLIGKNKNGSWVILEEITTTASTKLLKN